MFRERQLCVAEAAGYPIFIQVSRGVHDGTKLMNLGVQPIANCSHHRLWSAAKGGSPSELMAAPVVPSPADYLAAHCRSDTTTLEK